MPPDAMVGVWAVPAVVVVALATAMAAPQGSTTTTASPTYWWLEAEVSPFGGRNYNLEEVQRGEHIPPEEGKGGRAVKKITKRQADYPGEDYYGEYGEEYQEEYYDDETESFGRQELPESSDSEGGVISLNDIETECPAGTRCVETFFCAQFSGNSARDKIPCLLSRGEYAGQFGTCCTRRHPRVCPALRSRPTEEHCRPRPLGSPPEEECPRDGVTSSCPPTSLCCFNGCINVCLEDPPHSVQTSFWRRRMAVEVEPGESFGGQERRGPKDYQYDDNYEEYEEFDYEETPLEEEPVPDYESRASRLLARLLERIQSRIST